MTDPVTINPVVQLQDDRLSVQPGGQVRTRVTVTNTGTVVESYRIEVRGPAAGWTEVTPPDLPGVYTRAEATTDVVFSPPSGPGSPSGSVPFAVRVQSTVDPSRCATEEGDIEVGPVFGLQSKLTPLTSAGRWSAGHAVELSNWGNVPDRLRVTATDPDGHLAFLVAPEVVDLPVGGKALVGVRVRGRRPPLRGATIRRPFEVVAEPDGAPPGPPTAPGADPRRAVLAGAFEQKPLLSRAAVTGGTLGVLALGGVLAWALLADPDAPTSELPINASVAAPAAVTATAAGPDSVSLAWLPPERVDSYEVRQIAPETRDQTPPRLTAVVAEELDGELTGHTVPGLDPSTEYCFQVVSVRGESRSAASGPGCATTAPPEVATPTGSPEPTASPEPTGSPEPTASPTPTVAPSPTPGALGAEDWIAVVWAQPVAQQNREGADRHAATIGAEGLAVGELVNKEYPQIGRNLAGGAESFLLYVPTGAATEAGARAFCEQHPEISGNVGCLPVQPGEQE